MVLEAPVPTGNFCQYGCVKEVQYIEITGNILLEPGGPSVFNKRVNDWIMSFFPTLTSYILYFLDIVKAQYCLWKSSSAAHKRKGYLKCPCSSLFILKLPHQEFWKYDFGIVPYNINTARYRSHTVTVALVKSLKASLCGKDRAIEPQPLISKKRPGFSHLALFF